MMKAKKMCITLKFENVSQLVKTSEQSSYSSGIFLRHDLNVNFGKALDLDKLTIQKKDTLKSILCQNNGLIESYFQTKKFHY